MILLFGQLTDHYELLSLKKRQPPGKHSFKNDVSNDNNATTERDEENDNADTTIVNARKDLFWKTYKSGRGQYIDGDDDVTCVL